MSPVNVNGTSGTPKYSHTKYILHIAKKAYAVSSNQEWEGETRCIK